jgi:hypothetical protein
VLQFLHKSFRWNEGKLSLTATHKLFRWNIFRTVVVSHRPEHWVGEIPARVTRLILFLSWLSNKSCGQPEGHHCNSAGHIPVIKRHVVPALPGLNVLCKSSTLL